MTRVRNGVAMAKRQKVVITGSIGLIRANSAADPAAQEPISSRQKAMPGCCSKGTDS